MRAVVVSAILVIVILGLLFTPEGTRLDRAIVNGANAIDRRNPVVHALMGLGTAIGTRDGLFVGLMLPAAFGGEAARATVRVALVSTLGNQSIVHGLKWSFNRPRPFPRGEPRSNTAFPSGHASGAVGMAWVLAARHRRLAAWAWLGALWISSSRVFLGRHYPSDVLGGALIGILFAVLALALEKKLRSRRLETGE